VAEPAGTHRGVEAVTTERVDAQHAAARGTEHQIVTGAPLELAGERLGEERKEGYRACFVGLRGLERCATFYRR
jgi:hypothetical protein